MKKQPKPNPPCLTVRELAQKLNCLYEGNGETKIWGVSSLELAKEGDLVFLAHRKLRGLLEETKASAVVLRPEEIFERLPVIRSENPHITFIQAIEFFWKPYRPEPGIHSSAIISPSAKIGKDVSIGVLAYIGEDVEIGARSIIFPLVAVYPRVKIGEETVIHSHVSIREEVQIGSRVIIHNGVVIGSDGFGYLRAPDSPHIKIPQKGTVVIEDEVEIGANSTIDRGALGETVIRKGTKIDNLVQIAHNVEIGENCIIIAQTGIAGSTKLGKNVTTAGQVGIADHITIGDNVAIMAQAGVMKDIPANSVVVGTPHMEVREFFKVIASLPHLHDLIKDVRQLKAKIEELEKAKK
jgi:UDP-3-O-[3-hydroxymyristoyl] glucosamine N-acyltransferase